MPPPPPPPAPGGPPPPRLPAGKLGGGGSSSSGSKDRGALLADIRGGATLKKTVTNDRSAPVFDNKIKPSSNGGSYGGGGGGGGGGMMNGGVPQLGGLFAGGMPKLKPTGRGTNSSVGNSGPLLPPGRKPAPSVPQRDVSLDSEVSTSNDIPPSPKPSSKSSPAPPPPPATRKPTFPSDRPSPRGPLPEPPSPASKPRPNELNTIQNPPKSLHPSLPSKPVFVNKPNLGNKPAPPRPPNTSKPQPPPKSPGVQPNGSTLHSNRPATRTNSMREYRSSSDNEYSHEIQNFSKEDMFLPPSMVRTLPVPHHNNRGNDSQFGHGGGVTRSVTVGRAGGATIMKSLTRAPSERPPPPPNRPSVSAPPPPNQPPPPPPPHRPGPPSQSTKHEPPSGAPPQPPSRISSRQSACDFESKFSFHTAEEFPFPLTYESCAKTYPSKNAKPASQRRAPPPPPGPHPPLSSSMPLTSSNSSLHRFQTHTSPPPPPPHAPLHLQVGAKMYGTEASHC